MRQIGDSQEVIILEAISKQLNRLIKLRRNSITTTSTTTLVPTTTTTTSTSTTSTTTTSSNTAPYVSSFTSSKSVLEYTATYVYADNEGNLEAQIPPQATVFFTGVEEEGYLLTGSHIYFQLNGISEGATTYKWFRSNDTIGTGEVEVATTANYTLVSADVGKFMRRSVTPVTSAGLSGSAYYSEYSGAIAASVPFDPYTEITWNEAFDFRTSLDLVNYGSGNDATAPVSPAYDGGESAVRFTRASSQYLQSVANASHDQPLEIWGKFKTPASFSGTQTIVGLSSTHRVAYGLSGVLTLSGVSTGVTLTTSTEYKFRVYLNGASSIFRLISVGASTPISLSTNVIGTPTLKIGATLTIGNYFDGWLSELFIKAGTLTAGEITEMETYYGL